MAAPNLPLAPTEYDRAYQDQLNRVLALYFQQLANGATLSTAQNSTRATTDTTVIVTLTDGILLVDTTAGATTVVLPDPAAALDQVFGVKRTTAGANTLTIQSATGSIDGGTFSLVGQYDFLSCKSDGANYWIIGRITGWGY